MKWSIVLKKFLNWLFGSSLFLLILPWLLSEVDPQVQNWIASLAIPTIWGTVFKCVLIGAWGAFINFWKHYNDAK